MCSFEKRETCGRCILAGPRYLLDAKLKTVDAYLSGTSAGVLLFDGVA
jgi:hypothetical protein